MHRATHISLGLLRLIVVFYPAFMLYSDIGGYKMYLNFFLVNILVVRKIYRIHKNGKISITLILGFYYFSCPITTYSVIVVAAI